MCLVTDPEIERSCRLSLLLHNFCVPSSCYKDSRKKLKVGKELEIPVPLLSVTAAAKGLAAWNLTKVPTTARQTRRGHGSN